MCNRYKKKKFLDFRWEGNVRDRTSLESLIEHPCATCNCKRAPDSEELFVYPVRTWTGIDYDRISRRNPLNTQAFPLVFPWTLLWPRLTDSINQEISVSAMGHSTGQRVPSFMVPRRRASGLTSHTSPKLLQDKLHAPAMHISLRATQMGLFSPGRVKPKVNISHNSWFFSGMSSFMLCTILLALKSN